MQRSNKFFVVGLLLYAAMLFGGEFKATSMVQFPKGNYESFVPERKTLAAPLAAPIIEVASFALDKTPVTNEQFLRFVQNHKQWQKLLVSRLYSDATYLQHWQSALQLGPNAPAESPVVNISWFAARAYCEAQGKRLATVYEWEYAASAPFFASEKSGQALFLQELLVWYARPNSAILGPVGRPTQHKLGIHDLHGLIWEWTEDFNSVLASNESREGSALDSGAFCGAGSLGGKNPNEYASYMRFAFRSSLMGGYSIANLGFRCAGDSAP